MTSRISDAVQFDTLCPPESPRRRLSASAVVLAHLAAVASVLTMAPAGYHVFDVKTRIALVALALVFVSLAAVKLLSGMDGNRRATARWSVGPWYLIWGAFAFGAASVTWLAPQQGSAAMIERESVVTALYLIIVAVLVWTAGYLVGAPRPVLNFARNGLSLILRGTVVEVRAGKHVPWAMYGAGTAARALMIVLNGQIGYLGDASALVSSANSYTQGLRILSMLTVFGIAVAAHNVFARKPSASRLTLVSLFLLEVSSGAVQGNKEPIIIAGLAILVPYGAAKGRLPVRGLAIAALAFLLIVPPFNAVYRSEVRSGGAYLSTAEAFRVAPRVMSEVLQRDSGPGSIVTSFDTLFHRVRLIDNVAIIVQKTPSTIPYRSPGEYAYAFAGFVPRAVWPGKPIMVGGYEFSHEYYNLPREMYTSSAVTPVGDYFRHGGWLAVVICGFLLGMGFRVFDTLVRPEVDPRAIFFLLAFLPMLVKSETDSIAMLVAVPASVVTAAIGAHFACRRQRRPAQLDST